MCKYTNFLHPLMWMLLYVYFLLIMQAYIVYTQKETNIIYICKKKKNVQILQMCTTFANFYVFTI